MGVAAYLIFVFLKKKGYTKLGYIASALVAEIIMIAGYLFYEGIVLGLGVAAVTGSVGNVIQGVVSTIIGVTAIAILEKVNAINSLNRILR